LLTAVSSAVDEWSDTRARRGRRGGVAIRTTARAYRGFWGYAAHAPPSAPCSGSTPGLAVWNGPPATELRPGEDGPEPSMESRRREAAWSRPCLGKDTRDYTRVWLERLRPYLVLEYLWELVRIILTKLQTLNPYFFKKICLVLEYWASLIPSYPHISPKSSVFLSIPNTLPLPSGLWVGFYEDWVKIEVSPNTLADYPHKTSSTKQGLMGIGWNC
jgi:hypothetical protein